MKPSERIMEIIKEKVIINGVDVGYPTETGAILIYLDEQYKQDKLCGHDVRLKDAISGDWSCEHCGKRF